MCSGLIRGADEVRTFAKDPFAFRGYLFLTRPDADDGQGAEGLDLTLHSSV